MWRSHKKVSRDGSSFFDPDKTKCNLLLSHQATRLVEQGVVDIVDLAGDAVPAKLHDGRAGGGLHTGM